VVVEDVQSRRRIGLITEADLVEAAAESMDGTTFGSETWWPLNNSPNREYKNAVNASTACSGQRRSGLSALRQNDMQLAGIHTVGESVDVLDMPEPRRLAADEVLIVAKAV
jgi:hypothetical protein